MISRFAQTLVVALVMVVQHKFTEGLPQGSFSEQNYSFQARLLDGSDEAFRVGVEVGRTGRQFHRLHPTALQDLWNSAVNKGSRS